MNLYSTPAGIVEALKLSGTVRHDGGAVVTNPARFRAEMIDSPRLDGRLRAEGRRRDVARRVDPRSGRVARHPAGLDPAALRGARPRRVLGLHRPRHQRPDDVLRHRARRLSRGRRDLDAGAVIFEIARSEMGYTEQRPAEYAAVMLAAAIREGWEGPLFLQGDHFQTNPKKMKENAEKEIGAIEALIEEAIPAGFLQIDIDTSTLVDLSKPTLEEQQRVNAELCARFTKFIRAHEPKAMPISVGGEIGEVGKENSTPEEFRAYMNVYKKALGAGMTGIAKVSVQTGSSHGGVVAPDGSVERVAIDFDVIQRDLEGRARGVRPGRRGAARRLDAAARVLRPLPRPRLRRDPPRDRLHEHRLRPSRVPVSPEARDRALARRERRRGAQDAARRRSSSSTRRARRRSAPTRSRSGTCPRGRARRSATRSRRSSRSSSGSCASHDTRDIVRKYVKPVSVHAEALAAGPRGGFVRDDQAGD